jgi:opacity protein-like surface antigen
MQSSFVGAGVPGLAELGGRLEQDLIAGVGAGYQFNSYFRADVTGEYRFDSKLTSFNSYTNSSCGNLFNVASATCYDGYAGSVHTALFLVNGYVDLGTWYNVTPYFGVGVGTAVNTLSYLNDTSLTAQGGFGTTNGSNTHANLAWAAMAGFSYSLTRNLKLDVGWRYVDMGRVSSDAVVCNNLNGCHYESQHFHLDANDVRLGLRYVFTDTPAPQAFPVIAKY